MWLINQPRCVHVRATWPAGLYSYVRTITQATPFILRANFAKSKPTATSLLHRDGKLSLPVNESIIQLVDEAAITRLRCLDHQTRRGRSARFDLSDRSLVHAKELDQGTWSVETLD